jgi:hypothetical protein
MTDNEKKEDPKTTGVFSQIEGLTPVDPAEVEDFKRAMTEKVIPEIVKVVEHRRVLAADSRRRHLKY